MDTAVVWSIGDNSLSPHQFCDDWPDGHPGHVPEFRVGTDDPSASWPRFQAGPLNASTGFVPVAVAAVFDADQALARASGVIVAVEAFASHGPCPQLLIEINGHRGLYFLDPKRDSRADAAARLSPISGAVSLRARLPDGALHAGRNRLVITTTCVDQPDPAELTGQRLPRLGNWFGSGITWRRLALLLDHSASKPEVTLRPLPLFVERQDGLAELAELRVRSAGPLHDTRAVIELAGQRHDIELRADDRHFGDLWAQFAVPDPLPPGPARVRVRVGDSEVIREMHFIPCRKWTLHLLPHVHLDVGYTDRQAKVTELHSRNLERAVAILARNPDFRFTIDGSYVLSEFVRTRDGSRVKQVLEALRDGSLAVNAFSTLFLSGLASLEELTRSAYDTVFLGEDAGIQVAHAHLTDVPSYSWAIPAIVRELGIDGFFGIANHTRGGNEQSDALHLASPVRWQGPDGSDVLAFFADCYTQLRFMAADPPTVIGLAESLTRYTALYERDDYLPRDLPVVGTHADNEDLADGYADLIQQWSSRYAYPRLRFSTFSDYLEAVRPLRSRLPKVCGDGGSFWEDGAGTQAQAIATYRRAQVLLPGADSLTALTCVAYPALRPDRATLDRAWHNLLLGCEHTWSAAHATDRPDSHSAADIRDWKVMQITNAWRSASDEARRGLSQLAELTGARAPALVVYNPSARTRDLTVEHELPVSRRPQGAEGTAISVELLTRPRDGHATARFTVRGVKPFGYQVIPLIDGEPLVPAPWQLTPEAVSDRYVVSVDACSGRLASLTRRADGRQLLDTAAPYGLGEILYVSGGGDRSGRGLGSQSTSLSDYDPALPRPQLTVHRSRMHYGGHFRTPDGLRLRFRGAGPTLPDLGVDMRLFDDTDRIELTVHMRKEPELAKEAVYVAFPFSVQEPAFRYDRQMGWVEPARHHLPGSCNEWFAAQNGAAITGPSGGIVWASADAPLVTLDLVRGTWPAQCPPVTGTLFSWVMNNYWWTNTPASQEGILSLRYAFWPVARWDEAEASALVRDFRAPVLVDEISDLDRTMDVEPVLPPCAGQLISMSLPANADAKVYSSTRWDHGLLVRLQELGGQQAQVTISHPYGACGGAWFTTGAEQLVSQAEIGNSGEILLSLGRYQVRTLLLLPDQSTGPCASTP